MKKPLRNALKELRPQFRVARDMPTMTFAKFWDCHREITTMTLQNCQGPVVSLNVSRVILQIDALLK
jgi:hypothetical protein